MGVVGRVQRGDLYLVELDPTRGSEIRKTKPCVVISPEELNAHLTTFLVAPLTTGSHSYPFRIPCRFQGKQGHIVLDQIRAIDRDRLCACLGQMSAEIMARALNVLQEMFAP